MLLALFKNINGCVSDSPKLAYFRRIRHGRGSESEESAQLRLELCHNIELLNKIVYDRCIWLLSSVHKSYQKGNEREITKEDNKCFTYEVPRIFLSTPLFSFFEKVSPEKIKHNTFQTTFQTQYFFP